MNLKIDPEFESKIPPLTEDEFRQLEENILSDGIVINPIIVWNGVIVDGHNRFHIIEQHPEINFTTYEKQFCNRFAVIAWICRNQLGRRNLTPEQKKYLIGKQYEAEKATHGGERGNQYTNLASSQVGNLPRTCDRIAKENGISKNSVLRAESFSKAVDIADEVEPGLRSNLLAGEIKATEKDIRDLVTAEPEERPAIVERIKKPPSSNQERHRRPKASEPEMELVHKIGEDMLHATSEGDPDTMVYEMNDALDSLIFRWEFCHTHHRSFFDDEPYRSQVRESIRKGLKFMQEYEKGIFTDEEN